MKIKCLIVDDEPIARQIIEKYCSYIPELEIIDSCSDALKARQIIQNQKIDLMFLDINMPILDGISFMKALRPSPLIIFTTAYKEFAHDAFDIAAVDYLVKPFSIDRFIIAVDKVRNELKTESSILQVGNSTPVLYIKTEGKIHTLPLDEFHFAEAKGNHVRIVMKDFELSPTMTLTSLEDLLPDARFIRVHRSFIINKDKMRLIEGNRVFIGADEIPLGVNYREAFIAGLGMK